MPPRPVIVTMPPDLAAGTQVLVIPGDDHDNTEVCLRGGPRMAWTPIAHLGGTFEVRVR